MPPSLRPQRIISCSHNNADVMAPTAKTRQSEQGALKRGGIDLLVMPPKLKGRLPLWRVYSVNWLRGLVKPRNPYGRWPMPPSRVTVSPFMYLKSGPQS